MDQLIRSQPRPCTPTTLSRAGGRSGPLRPNPEAVPPPLLLGPGSVPGVAMTAATL